MKHKTLLLLCLCLLAGINTFAYDAEIDGIYYNFSGDEATVVSGRTEYSGIVTIPNSVTQYSKTYSVTCIGIYAFSGCSSLTSVTIPESVTVINYGAFQNCSGLTSITIPNSVTSIDTYAFYGCSSLTSVTIPNSVTSIGNSAFYNCSSLTSVTIPDSVTSIGAAAFCSCSGLTSITIPNSVTSIGNDAFSGCSSLTSVTIPENVTIIYYGVFQNCSGLTSITIPNSVTSIGNSAFWGCSSLTSVIIGNSVTSIGNAAFQGCESLTSITIPHSVTNIDQAAFNGCINLNSVVIPSSVTSIDNPVFNGCSGLTSIIVEEGNASYDSRENCNAIIETSSNTLIEGCMNTVIPHSVTSIGESAFAECSGLTSITIPVGVTSIGENAFDGCRGLTSVIIPNSVISIDAESFYGCSSLTDIILSDNLAIIEEETFAKCRSLTSVTIPNSVTSIGESAFWGCRGLTSITIPASVTSIGEYAFYGCSLTSVKVKNAVPVTIDEGTFGNSSNATLDVPKGSMDAYMAAPYWNEFKEILEFEPNEIYLSGAEGVTGRQMKLPVALNNEDRITGLQMDLYLPEGMTVATNSRGKPLVAVTDRMDGNYSLSCRTMPDGFMRIVGFSPDNDVFTGEEGDILTVTIDVDESVSAGEYAAEVKDIVLSDVDNVEYHPADTTTTIQIKAQGDVDGSGAVNINDVVCIVNHILKRETGTFIEKAADVDGSGSININDVVVLIDRFILQRTDAPRHAHHLMAEATEDRLYVDDLYMVEGETMEIAMKLSNTHDVRAVQGNIKLPEGFSFVTKSNGRPDVRNLDERSEDFTLSCEIQDDGSMTFTQYSIDGYTYEGNEGGIFTFKITAGAGIQSGTYSMSLTDVILSIGGKAYEQPDSSCTLLADGIKAIDNGQLINGNEGVWYSPDGRRLDKPQRGINIIRYADGNGKKVLVK